MTILSHLYSFQINYDTIQFYINFYVNKKGCQALELKKKMNFYQFYVDN